MWRIFLTVSLLCWSADGRVTCRDHNDKEVDWFIIYKAPVTGITKGLEYLYIDSKGTKMETLYSKKLINDPKGVLANTLRPILKEIKDMPPDFGFISYSDQPPGCHADDTFGHSKGLVMMEKNKQTADKIEVKTGVWLLHSTPRFPYERDQNKKNFYPDSGAMNAQTFICVTFNYDQFKQIGEHLLDINAFTFDDHIPNTFYENLQKLRRTENNYRTARDIEGKPRPLTSAGLTGAVTQFQSIAKQRYIDTKKTTNAGQKRKQGIKKTGNAGKTSAKKKQGSSTVGKLRRRRAKSESQKEAKADSKAVAGIKKTVKAGKTSAKKKQEPSAALLAALANQNRFVGDLYSAIAKEYGTKVRVQTWHSTSSENQPTVTNIECEKTALGNQEVKWGPTKDHSKWCVATDNNNNKKKNLICIADMNRCLSQYKRPGGALCFEDEEASTLFKGVIASDCPKPASTPASDPDCVSDQ